MLFLRVPTSDKHPRQGSPPQTPACWAKRGSHRLAFPPEREVKSPRCRRRLLRCAGSARQHPRVPLLRVPLPRAAQPRPRASPGPQPRWKWIFTSPGKAQLATAGPGGGWSRSSLSFPNANEPVPRLALGSGVLGFCFIRLSIGSGKETQSFPIARCHMENLRCFDYALCKHFNIGSLKSRDCPKGD